VRVGDGEQVGEYLVDTTTIDKYCADTNIFPDFIKTDTEGSDLSFLIKEKRCLSKIIGIRSEIHFEQAFIGAPTFADIFCFLTSHGFIKLNRDYDGRSSDLTPPD